MNKYNKYIDKKKNKYSESVIAYYKDPFGIIPAKFS